MKMINQFISQIYNKDVSSQNSVVATFKPGQLFYGRIIKLFPNNLATLQIGSQQIVAQLELALEADGNYWFQVQPGEGTIRLKVIGNGTGYSNNNLEFGLPETNKNQISSLLKALSIPVKEENIDLVKFFLKENLPVTKEMFSQTVDLLQENKFSSISLETVKYLFHKGLPLTKDFFEAINTVFKNEPLVPIIKNLISELNKGPQSDNRDRLAHLLEKIIDPEVELDQMNSLQNKKIIDPQSTQIVKGEDFATYLKKIIRTFGYSYEYEAIQSIELHKNDLDFKLKPLLIEFLKEQPLGEAKELSEKILQKITGLQLLTENTGPIQQVAVQIPVPLLSKTTELTIQWSGRKNKNGEIDPAYCRILFYLELSHLRDTIIDMQVQNKIMTIQVINENKLLREIAKPFIETLKKNLKDHHFHLSSVNFIVATNNQDKSGESPSIRQLTTTQYTGVDLKI